MKHTHTFSHTLLLAFTLALAGCGGARQEAPPLAVPAPTTTTPQVAATPGASPQVTATPGASPQAAGNAYRYEAGGLQFTIPAGWKKEVDKDALNLTAPDDKLAILVWNTAPGDYEASLNAALKELEQLVKNPRFVTEGKEGEHNGLKTVSSNGTGEIEGKPALFDLTLFNVEAKKRFVFILAIADAEAFKQHEAAYTEFVGSIRPL